MTKDENNSREIAQEQQDQKKHSTKSRPSLFVIKGILDSIDKGIAHNHGARFSELAFATPELRNRKKMLGYLDLLVNNLGWVEKKEQTGESSHVSRRGRASKKWSESWYYLTDKGKAFISLFPPSEREQGHRHKRPGLLAIKSVLEKAEGGFFNFSSLAEVTVGASNRKNLSAYLKLLCDELGWLERKDEEIWTKSPIYDRTEKGQAFLDLFSQDENKTTSHVEQ